MFSNPLVSIQVQIYNCDNNLYFRRQQKKEKNPTHEKMRIKCIQNKWNKRMHS
jgi:hypothetical protein